MKRKANSTPTIVGRLCTGLAAATMALFQLPVAAEDIDLFIQPPPDAADLPNVLIILDNTGNWSAPFVNEIDALKDTLEALPSNQFRVGLMLFTETGEPNNPIDDGGYVRAAIRAITASTPPSTTDTRPLYVNLLDSLDVIADRSNSGKAALTMMEAYKYFDGQRPRSGNFRVKTDFDDNSGVSAASDAIYALPGNALDDFDSLEYHSPIVDGSCGKNFIIYISNGAVQESSSDSQTARNGLANEGGNTTAIPLSPSGSQSNMADEWARFMYHQSPHKIVTFTLDVDKVITGQGPGWTELLDSMAENSEGANFDVSSGNGGEQIKAAMGDIFSQIQGVNSVFASVSLPVSVNTEGTYLNQIYIGMFRPDSAGLPRWSGNLKQYKLGISGGQLETQDADSRRAVNNSTGFITECARSFWTPSTTDAYWSFLPDGYWRTLGITTCLAVAGSEDSNYPDGNIVEKGAQAYKLRAPTTGRASARFRTCSGTCTTLDDVDDASAKPALAATTTEQDQLIDWMNGLDIDDEDDGNEVTAERRPSIHGDVVHSRPVAINMNTGPTADVSPRVVVFYGGNDGVLRAVNGNRTADIGSFAAGEEMWAFVPPEFYPHIKRLRDNNVEIDTFGNNFISPLPKPYGVDGPIIAHRNGSNLWLFASLRRGGRSIYAFDVTSMDSNPGNTTLLWRAGCPNPDVGNDTGCTSGLDEIGQTWSAPKVVRAMVSGTPKPVLVVGGGYDPCEDTDPFVAATCSGPIDLVTGIKAPKGNRIFVLDASTGARITEFNTDRGVVSDVFVVTNLTTGNAQWIYAADLGGNIYRISGDLDANTEIGTTDPSTWVMTRIASLGCATASTGCDPLRRKFMMPLDVVQDVDGSYVILLGSGDREKPLLGFTNAAQVDNYFFKIVDRPTESLWLTAENATCSTDVICFDSLLKIPATPVDPDNPNPDPNDLLAHPKGWALEMSDTEQVVTAAITVFGTTTFSTHTPTVPVVGSCDSNLGTALVYNIAFANAASANGTDKRFDDIVGDGLPPSPVAGMVMLDDGTTVPFLIGGETNSPLEGGEPIPSGLADQPKAQTYWYIHK